MLPNFCPQPSHCLERIWHTLDFCRAFHIYLKQTSSIRRSENIFVSFQPASLGYEVTSYHYWVLASGNYYQGLRFPGLASPSMNYS